MKRLSMLFLLVLTASCMPSVTIHEVQNENVHVSMEKASEQLLSQPRTQYDQLDFAHQLDFAELLDVAELLLEEGTKGEDNVRDRFYGTPLHWAAKYGQPDFA